jgi:hypothetical protein
VSTGSRAVTRLWRVRKLHRHIDAEIRGAFPFEVRLRYGDRVMYRCDWPTREQADADAAAKLADLVRAGWTAHW